MGLKKGQTNNPAGRPKGSINKANKELREMIKNFLTENLENFQEEFVNLNTKDKLKFIADILPYGLPKYQPTEVEKEDKGTPQLNVFQQINQKLRDEGYKCGKIDELQPFNRQQ